MNTKHFFAILALSAGVIPSLHAADAPAADQQGTDKPVLVAEVKSMAVVGAPVMASAGKSREQVVAELVESIKDGSYVAPSEIYPAQVTGTARR